MQQQPPRQGHEAAAYSFEAKVENEEQVIDGMLASLARGALPAQAWENLHAAAQRDDRLSELAFAFETVAQGKRLKTVQPAVGAEFLFQAGRFFGDVFGDELGAVTYLERGLALAPNHAGVFGKIETFLVKAEQPKKLADLYVVAAQHRPRGEQAPMLRRAVELLVDAGGADERVMELLQQVLRLDPADDDARVHLEALYLRLNRFRDVVRLNEQALAAEPPPSEAMKRALLERIVELYADKLQEPERAIPHVEQLLAIEPAHEGARKVAQKLVVIKGLAGRAAAALATASETVGTPQDVARYISIELESTRGPRRATLLARLGKLKHERMGDDPGALEAFEQALAIDAADDDVRARYVTLAAQLERYVDAAKALSRVLATAKDPGVKARTSAQLGRMLLCGGDVKRAKATLAGVLALQDAPADAALEAAWALREILEKEKDARALCDVLERIAGLEPDSEKRREVDERLSELATKLKDTARAVAAYERLLSTSARAKALAALIPLYEASGDADKQARLLEERAIDSETPANARELLMRAAEVRVKETKDATAAIATCHAIVERFGPARDVHALMIPLLEAQRSWPELAEALAQDATLASGRERAEQLSRLGMLRMQRLRDMPGALESFKEALGIEPQERVARSTLEKLAAHGDNRLAAAGVLEPVYRAEGASGPLLKVLELRGSLAANVDERLGALREAADLAAGSRAGENARAVDAVARGLAEAVTAARPLGEWLERLDRVAGAGSDPQRRAAILGTAIGTREVTSEELGTLAKRAAEASGASGDAPTAIALYRRALAFEPQSAELLSRIDDLLRDQGSPRERIALYRAALASSNAARRRELLHRIGAMERHDLGDAQAAIATYRAVLEDDADDADANAALEELYAQAQLWDELCSQLDGRLARAQGDAVRTLRAKLAQVAAAHGDETRARTQCARLLEDPQLAPEHLDAVERAADVLGDADLARAALHRRAEMAQEPREQIAWLDKLGEVDQMRRGDLQGAAAAWTRAGELAEAAGDDETARRLYGRARSAVPRGQVVAGRLAALCERAELWEELPGLYTALADNCADDGERVELTMRTAQVLADRLGDLEGAADHAARALRMAPGRADVLASFEKLSTAAGAIGRFEQVIDDVLSRPEQAQLEADQIALLLLARARALSGDSTRADESARAYRGILEDGRFERSHQASALAAFDELIARDPESPRRRTDRRWLHEWRAQHAPEEERVARLLEWARLEETAFEDPGRALGLHRRVLEIDAECDEARSSVARLALATGDVEEALSALRARRDRAQGPTRLAIELEIARVLIKETTRSTEALSALREVLAEVPSDPAARALASELLAHRATRPEAVAMLERACEASDDAEARAQILVSLLDAPAGSEDAQARQGWFERLSDLQREQGSIELALRTAARAARELPDVAALWDRVERLARTVSRPDDVATLYEEVLARTLTHEQTLAIGERAVQFYEEWFEDSTRVVRILERVLELDPTADWAFDRLKLALDAGERWDDLFALYDRALASATGKKRAALLEDAAQTAKDFADRPDRAIQYLEQLRELKPNDAKLTGALERLYERQGRHRELVSLLTARLPTQKRDEARRTRVRVAALWLDELGDAAAALEMIEPLIEQANEGAADPASELWALLERVLAAAPQTPDPRRSSPPPGERPRSKRPRKSEPPSSSRGSVRQRAAAWLRGRYEATGRDADLARMLLIELETARSTKERVRRHLQVAELYEKVGDLPNALEQIGLAVTLAPGDEAQRAKLVALAERTGRLDRLADLLAGAAEAADAQSLRVALKMEAAAVRADRVGDAAGGIALLSSVLAIEGISDQEVLASARKLEPLLEATGRVEERLDVAERIANVERDQVERREAIGRAARLAAQLGQNARGVGLWERRLAEDGRDLEALDGLVDLLEQGGHSERLAQVLELRAAASTNQERRRSDRVRVAKLLGDVLDRAGDAIEAWRGVERDFGEADDAAVALTSLLRANGRWEELAKLLDRRVQSTSEATERAELLRQLGDVQREQLGAHDSAVNTYAQSLAADPRNAGARAGLQVLAGEDQHRPAAVDVLLGALRTCDDWQGVLELTAHRLLAATSDAAKLAVLLETADTAERRAADVGMAFEAMRRAFAVAPGDDRVQSEIERLAAASGGWSGLVDTYRDAIGGAARGDSALVVSLWRRMGATLEARLDDAPGALAAYLHVVADAADTDAGCSAVRVAARIAAWDVAARVVVDLARARGTAPTEVLEVVEQVADEASAWLIVTRAVADATSAGELSGAAARDIHARLAEWHRERRGDLDSARTALERALEHDAANPTLLAALVELQRPTRGRALVETLVRLSRARGGDLALLREAAEVARDSLADRALARSIDGELLELARDRWLGGRDDGAIPPGSPQGPWIFAHWAIEDLARLHDEDGDATAMLDVLAAGDDLPFELTLRRDMRRRAARVALDRLGDHERGIALYLRLFDEDPHDEEAALRLASTYLAHGRTKDLLSLRERQIAAAPDVEERVLLRLEASRLLVDLGDGGRAAETLRASLKEDPRHGATVEALVAVLDAQGLVGELRDLLAEQAEIAERATDAPRAAALWWRAAVLAQERLQDLDAAAAFHARVVALEPRPASLDALARLAEARHDPATAAQWLSRLLDVVEAERRVDTILRLGEALVATGEPERAAERLEQSLLAAPDAEAVRTRLAALYRDRQEWAKLARLVSDAAGHAPDKATRMARLLEAASLYADRCGDPPSAIPLLEQATDLAPEDQTVRLSLADKLARAQRFDEARAILRSMIDAFGGRRPKERAPVHYEIARLELAMGNRAQALVELDTATRVDPQNPEILRTLAELARDDGQLERAEKSYRALLVVLRRREDTPAAVGIARSEVLLELSAIAERHGEGERASEILESALEAGTQSDFEQSRLENALRARGDHEMLVRVIESKLSRSGDSPDAAQALAELAEVLADRLGRPEQALAARLRAIAISPGSAPAHDAALALARSIGSVERYVDGATVLADRAVESGDVTLGCALLVRLGGVSEQDLGDDRKAAALYERAVDLGQKSPALLRALDGVYERLGDAEKQARVLAMRVEAESLEGGPRAACDAIYRLAVLRLASRHTLDEGAEMMRTAVALDPQLDRAEQALRRALELDPAHLRLLDLYEHVGRQPGHERTLVDALRLRAQLPGGDFGTVREAVEVAMRIGDVALAESLLERVAEAQEGSSPNVADLSWTLGALASLRETAGDLAGAVELKKRAARIADPEVARRLEFEVARIATDKLGDLTMAAETYESLHLADLADREAWEPLVEVYRRLGDARKLADLLATVVDYVDDSGERARLRLERVRTMMRGLDLDDSRAAALLREIVDEDASLVEAALMLAEILERTGAHEDLAALLAQQIDSAKDRGDAPSIAALALRLGKLLEEGDRAQARNTYYTGLDWEPGSRDLLAALLRLLDGEEDAGEHADVLERRLAVETGPSAEEMALRLWAARMSLSDAAAAERALEAGYRGYPGSVTLRERLEGAYRERRDWRKLAELCVLDASARADVGERVARLREAAALWRTELEDAGAAASALALARELAPDDAALLRDRVDLLIEAGDHAAAIAELGTAIDRLPADDSRRAAWLASRAHVRGSVGDEAGALEDLEAAFALDREPHAPALAARLERAAQVAATAGDTEAARVLRLRQAQVLPYAHDADGARTLLGELLRQDPKDASALQTLASLETALERWDAASAALRRLVGLEEGEAGTEVALRLADACERAGRPGDARGALERARLVAPTDRTVRERLERVYEQTGAWHELADVALEDARANGDVAERFALLLRAGSLLLEQAGDPDAATGPLEEARALRPTDPDCAGLLADALTFSGRAQDALGLLEEVMAPYKGRRARELAPLYWRLARVARHSGDAASEGRSLVHALECDAQNGQVCSDVAQRAMELGHLELANRALRAITLLKTPGPMSKALAYQYMGEIAQSQGDPKRALTLAKRALAEDPTLEGARALAHSLEQ
jgi:golgin subfamily B member 1